MQSIVAANSTILHIQTSKLERQGPAIFLQPHITLQPWITTKGEIAHFHTQSEGSGHVLLSAADAKEVIGKGWGQRHGLSGTAVVPASYVLIYAPRDEEEVRIVGELLKAGARCVSGGMEIV